MRPPPPAKTNVESQLLRDFRRDTDAGVNACEPAEFPSNSSNKSPYCVAGECGWDDDTDFVEDAGFGVGMSGSQNYYNYHGNAFSNAPVVFNGQTTGRIYDHYILVLASGFF